MKVKWMFFTVACVVLLSSCSGGEQTARSTQSTDEVTRTVYAMDTAMLLKAYGENAEAALDDAETEILRLDDMLRRGNPESEIYKVNTEKSAEVSEDTAELVSDALEICASTEGVFDISIAPVMDLWGFYTTDYRVPSDSELSQYLPTVNYKNISVDGSRISVDGGSQLDLGGIAKGFLSGRIMDIFRENGVESGIISLGGNVQTLGKKPGGGEWRVAIQNPDDNDTYIGAVSAENKAVITSGGYQRFFEQDGITYHHIIDPETGYPAQSGVKSVTIVSDNGTLADGLSTALFVMGLDRGTEYWRSHEDFDVIFMTDDNRIYITQGLEDIFESEFSYSVITK